MEDLVIIDYSTLSVHFYKVDSDANIDEEGEADFSNCDLKKAVEENIKLPNTEGWILDDFTVLMEWNLEII